MQHLYGIELKKVYRKVKINEFNFFNAFLLNKFECKHECI